MCSVWTEVLELGGDRLATSPEVCAEWPQGRPVLQGREASQLVIELCQERGESPPHLRRGWRSQVPHIVVGCVGKENDYGRCWKAGTLTLGLLAQAAERPFRDPPGMDRGHQG